MVIIALLLILAVGPRATVQADGEVRRRRRSVDRCPVGPAPPVNGHQWSCWKPVRLLWRWAGRTGGETLALCCHDQWSSSENVKSGDNSIHLHSSTATQRANPGSFWNSGSGTGLEIPRWLASFRNLSAPNWLWTVRCCLHVLRITATAVLLKWGCHGTRFYKNYSFTRLKD